MLEALWTVQFESDLGRKGGGVLIFETNRIFGGDSQYYYVGKYEVQNGVLEGEIEVTCHTGPGDSVFGELNNFTIKASGRVQEPEMVLTGNLVQEPRLDITILCTHQTDLP